MRMITELKFTSEINENETDTYLSSLGSIKDAISKQPTSSWFKKRITVSVQLAGRKESEENNTVYGDNQAVQIHSKIMFGDNHAVQVHSTNNVCRQPGRSSTKYK